jgi:hypothetical protein
MPADILEMRKRPLTISLAKPKDNAQKIPPIFWQTMEDKFPTPTYTIHLTT